MDPVSGCCLQLSVTSLEVQNRGEKETQVLLTVLSCLS